tara:strand:- start:630 stop:1061 length:432 start_codon:yes stop_codon:yes gene_type:complete
MNSNIQITESAGGIVLNSEEKILIVNQNHDSWSLPKGHVDPGETILEAAKREIYEESGVKQLDYIRELGCYERFKIGLDGNDDKKELKRIHIFLFKTNQMALNPIDPMNPEARWCTEQEIIELLTHKEDVNFFISIQRLISNI